MLENLQNIDLQAYGLYLNKVIVEMNNAANTSFNLEFTMPFMGTQEDNVENMDKFLLDLQLINAIRNNSTPSVQKQYQDLLLTLALTKSENNNGDK